MRAALPADSRNFGDVVANALSTAGGVDLARAVYADPAAGDSLAELLAGLGAFDIDVRDGFVELAAAAMACRAAGSHATPYPLAERLCGPVVDAPGLVFVDRNDPIADHGDLMIGWPAMTRDGTAGRVVAVAADRAAVIDPFARRVTVEGWSPADTFALSYLLLLTSFEVLGSLQSAARLAVQHSRHREQFGAPISKFQVVEFHVADVSVEVMGLEELAIETLRRAAQAPGAPDRLADAVGLYCVAQEAAEVVLRTTHQIHGAVGFCDEHDLSWLSRYGQSLRRGAVGRSAALAWLAETIDEHGFDSLFPVAGRAYG